MSDNRIKKSKSAIFKEQVKLDDIRTYKFLNNIIILYYTKNCLHFVSVFQSFTAFA